MVYYYLILSTQKFIKNLSCFFFMKGVYWVLLTAIISGFSIFLNAFGVKVVGPSVFTTLKNSLVAILLVASVLLWKQKESLVKKDWMKLALIGLLGGSIPFLLFFNGISMIGGASASFVHKTMFIFVGVFSYVLLKEKLSKKTWLGAVLLLGGNSLLLSLTSFKFNIGLFYVALATIFWAAEVSLSKYVLKHLKSRTVMLGRMGFGALFLIIYTAFTGELAQVLTLTGSQIVWTLITSVLLFGYVFTFYTGLAKVKATLASMILLLGSAITTLLQLLFLDNVFTLSQLLGAFVLLAGVAYVLFVEKEFKLSVLHKQDV
jgi:drug/metabolite transporter (DMT)-like permease